jgi:hypothetical protein
MDLTPSAGSDSEVKADKFTGALNGNANTATTLSSTLTVAKGGTGNTAFANKAVIISQDSGTDKLSAVTMATNGQLLIGGTSGPAAATLTAGNGIDITNGNNTITVTAETASTSNAGVAKFSSLNFDFSGDTVRIKDLGVATAEIQNDAVTFGKMQNVATKTIMGRTAANTGDAKALSAAEARGILNVANGADKYSSFNIRANTNAGTAGANHAVGSGTNVAFQGVGATSVTRSGGTIKISSNNTTYTAAGGSASNNAAGIYLDGTTFKLGYVIRPHKNLYIGNNLKTQIFFHGNAGGGRDEDPYINFFTSQSSSPAMTLRVAKHMTGSGRGAPADAYKNRGCLYNLNSVEVYKKTPTYANEVTSKEYVDSQRTKVAAASWSGSAMVRADNCSIAKVSTGVYRITLNSSHVKAGRWPVISATLGLNPSADADINITGTDTDRNSANPLEYNIYVRRDGSTTNKFIVETTKIRSYGQKSKWNDYYIATKFARENVDVAWQCIAYNGEF